MSKGLLDGEIPGQNTIFFRAGHLRVPVSLPEALKRSGYQFDSSFTADDVLSNFPFALPRDLGFEEDSDIYEFPVTIEDEESPGFAKRVPQALQVILANAENGAVSVVLIHSNESHTESRSRARLTSPASCRYSQNRHGEFWHILARPRSSSMECDRNLHAHASRLAGEVRRFCELV